MSTEHVVELPEFDLNFAYGGILLFTVAAVWACITFVSEGSCGLRGRLRQTTGKKRR